MLKYSQSKSSCKSPSSIPRSHQQTHTGNTLLISMQIHAQAHTASVRATLSLRGSH